MKKFKEERPWLTPQNMQEYVDGSGLFCPFCGDDDIGAIYDIALDGPRAVQEIDCFSCRKTWKDIYTLTGIEL